MSTYEIQRQENILRNQALLKDLGLHKTSTKVKDEDRPPPSKKRKLSTPALRQQPTRSSARIAASTARPNYTDDNSLPRNISRSSTVKKQKPTSTLSSKTITRPDPPSSPPRDLDLTSLETNWYKWTISAPPPDRDDMNTFHFPSHPTFLPNKSPFEILSQGAFGGSYYRPLYSRTLSMTFDNDYKYLPPEWIRDLDVEGQLISTSYVPERNKYGVKCGQSIEEWEGMGWINARWDVRGWFQWYERFFRGRRGEDDDRQVGRWERCVGERGRWRRALIKQYIKRGVKFVSDEGLDDEEVEVSPVLSQTCFHWAWEMDQKELDKAWREGL